MRTAALMAVLMVAGCSAQEVHGSGPAAAPAASAPAAGRTMQKLDGTEWRFVEVGGTAVPAGVTATLRIRGRHVSGRAGCNNYGGSYQVGGDGSVSIGQIMSTKMACLAPPGAMEVERRIFAVLPNVSKMELRGGDLALLDAEGKPLARLKPANPS